MQFVVGQKYSNGVQKYEVVAIDGDRMLVELDGGLSATLSQTLQLRRVAVVSSRLSTSTYENHCWKCQTDISSETNEQCSDCRGYICSWTKCRVCFCDYPFRRGTPRIGFAPRDSA